MSGIGAALAAALLTLSVPGCGRIRLGGHTESAISRERFIDAVVALRQVEGPARDSTAFRGARDSVLREEGVSSAELAEFARVHGGDIEYMSLVWDSIEARLRGRPPSPQAPSGAPAAAPEPPSSAPRPVAPKGGAAPPARSGTASATTGA